MTEIQPFIFPTTGQSVRTLLVGGRAQFQALMSEEIAA